MQQNGYKKTREIRFFNIKINKSRSSDGACEPLLLEERIISLKKKGPAVSGEPGSNIRGISMNCELIPRATAVGHSSSFCGFALAGSATFSPESALLASRDESQTLRKITFFSPPVQLQNMKITSAGAIKLVWPLTTRAEPDSLSRCRRSCERSLIQSTSRHPEDTEMV